jgi:ribonucleoside-triphosphate reductase
MERLQNKYPEEIFNIQGISNKARDLNEFSKKFFSKSADQTVDLTVDQNANVSTKTVSQYTAEHNKANQRLNGLYLIWKFLKKNELSNGFEEDIAIRKADEIIESIVNGEIFVNDLASVERPYCWGQSLEHLVFNGADFLNTNLKIGPPKRADSYIQLIIQSMAYISNQITGAIALPDVFFYFDWYLRKDYGENYIEDRNFKPELKKKLENLFQHFIYSLNIEFRLSQSMFSNISIMDRKFLESLFADKVYPDFSKPNLESVRSLGMWFFEYFASINMKEGIFTFPIFTLACSVVNDEYGDPDFIDWVSKVNCEKAIGNVYTGDVSSISSCCRLKNDLKVLDYQNSFGVGGISIGSHRVCGLNLPRLWKDYEKNSEQDFIEFTNKKLNAVKKVLDAHRKIIEYHIEIGVLPLYTHGWMNLNKQYSTVGVIGVYELQQYFNKIHSLEDEASKIKNYEFSLSVLKNIQKNIEKWNADSSWKYNLEQIPGESVAVRLAGIDRIMGLNDEYEMYSNQYVPLVKNNVSISDRFKIQGKFDSSTSGGSILHINVDEVEHITPEQFRKLFDIALKYKTVYWSLNYMFIRCSNNHFFIGNNSTDNCPVCNSNKLEFYTRVVGFVTNVKNWVNTRREWEFPNRKFYKGIF